jgi:NADH-quinone oxidoreductase subunit M
MTDFPWLTVLLAVPLLGAAVVAGVPGGREQLAKRLALGFALATLGVAIAVALRFDAGAAETYQLGDSYRWIPQFGVGFSLGVSGISLALIALTAVLTPVCILASWHDAEPRPAGSPAATPAAGVRVGRRRVQTFFALLLVLEALMLGVFAATDVFLFYVLFEAMLIPMYFIIGSYGGAQRSYAAVKFLLYSLFGGLLMLAALIGLYVESRQQLPAGQFPNGTFDLVTLSTQLEIPATTQRLLFLGFFIAFAIKAPLWPLHTWLPDAAAEAPSGGAVLMVSVMDKVGTFGMIALCLPLFPEASVWAAPVVVVLAVIGILYGALVAIGQTDIKRLIAYTSVSHFGFIILGIFAMTSQGQSGATLYMVNHGFSTAALFLIAGMMISRRGSRLIADYGGVQRVAPLLAGSFLVAGLSSLALPGLSSFVSEFLVLVGTFSRYQVAAVLATVGIVLAALYILLMYQRTMTGPVRPGVEGMRDLVTREAWVVAPVLAVILALGFYPKPLLDVINPAVERTLTAVEQEDPEPTVPVAEGTHP